MIAVPLHSDWQAFVVAVSRRRDSLTIMVALILLLLTGDQGGS